MEEQASQAWRPGKEELAAILAELQPIIRAFARRDRERAESRTARHT